MRVTPDGPPIDRLTLFRRPTELRAVSKLDLLDLLGRTLTRQLLEGPGAVDGDV